jgi:hypothetical protein
MRDLLGFRRRPEWSCIPIALYANCTDLRTTATKVKIPAVPQERIGTDYGLHYRHAVSHFLVVMDVLGPETPCPYVGLIGASGGARQSSVIWRLRRPSARGHQESTHARWDPGLANGDRQSFDIIPQPWPSQAG